MTAKDLKNALLQEAVQGKLVPQIASEDNARDLLEEVRKERGESLPLASARKRSSATPSAGSNAARNARFAPITEDEIPFEIPENWCWCRLGEICKKLVDGDHNPPAGLQEKTEYLMLSSRNINDDKLVDLDLVRYLSKEVFEKENERTKAEKGDIFFTSVGTLGRSCIFDGSINVSFQRSVSIIKTEIFNYYLKYCLDSGYVQNFVVKNATGTAQKGFYLNQLAELIIPLPPLAEQKRIVAAIEKFMPLIEEYGKKETQLKAINEKIGTLTKKAILQEAVQGKLVPQIAAEGNAKDLLEEIKKEKLIKEGKIKKEKPLPEITEDEIPFEIPESWCWCRLSEYLDIRDGTHDSPKFYDNGIPFVTSKNLNDGILDFSTCKYITEEDHKKFSARSFVEDDDILFAMIGSIGNPVIVKKKFDFSFKNMALFKRYTKEKTDMKYIFYYLSYIQFELKRIATGGVQSFIGLGTFREMLFPLPPLAEQKRIVAAIEKMLPLCEKLGE